MGEFRWGNPGLVYETMLVEGLEPTGLMVSFYCFF